MITAVDSSELERMMAVRRELDPEKLREIRQRYAESEPVAGP